MKGINLNKNCFFFFFILRSIKNKVKIDCYIDLVTLNVHNVHKFHHKNQYHIHLKAILCFAMIKYYGNMHLFS